MAININAKTTGVGGLETSADNSGNINIQSGGTTVMSVTSSGVAVTGSFSQNGAVYSTQPTFRNLIINGDMKIAQRGTSFAAASGYTLDRFTFTDDATSVFTITQSTDVPSGQGFANSMKFDCTTANASLGSSDQIRQVQRIEAQNLQHLKYGTSDAETLTCSFWVKSNKTGIYCVTLSQPDDGYAAFTTEYTISSANTWEKKTVTFSGDTGGVINNDNGDGLWIMFVFGAGSGRHITADSWNSSYGLSTSNQVNLADSTSNELYLTGVQLEVGSTATDFENLPYDVQLQRCQRYYQEIIAGRVNSGYIGQCESSIVQFGLPLAQAPRFLARYDGSGTMTKVGDVAISAFPSGGDNITGVSNWAVMSNMLLIGLTTSGSITNGQSEPVRFGSVNEQKIFTLDTEL